MADGLECYRAVREHVIAFSGVTTSSIDSTDEFPATVAALYSLLGRSTILENSNTSIEDLPADTPDLLAFAFETIEESGPILHSLMKMLTVIQPGVLDPVLEYIEFEQPDRVRGVKAYLRIAEPNNTFFHIFSKQNGSFADHLERPELG